MVRILLWGERVLNSVRGSRHREAQLLGALVQAGHEVHIVSSGPADRCAKPSAEPGSQLQFHPIREEQVAQPEALAAFVQKIQPTAILTTSLLAASSAAQLEDRAPFWADFAFDPEPAELFQQGQRLVPVLERAAGFSCATAEQRNVWLSLLGWRGRLGDNPTDGQIGESRLVQVLPIRECVDQEAGFAPLLRWLEAPGPLAPESLATRAAQATARAEELAAQLNRIQHSKMWRVWMLYIQIRRSILAIPRAFGQGMRQLPAMVSRGWRLRWRLVDLTVQALFGVGALALLGLNAFWCHGLAWLRRRRPVKFTLPSPRTNEKDVHALLGRRPRMLIVSPYAIYPPHHGGGVRLYNLIQHLSRTFELYLLIFHREGDDPAQRAALAQFCVKLEFHRWQPRFERRRFSLAPPSAELFWDPRAALRVADLVHRHNLDLVQLEYTELAQYRKAAHPASVILVEHDIAFRSFARRRRLGFAQRFPNSRYFGATWGDGLQLWRYEVRACREVDQVHAMSAEDGAFLASFLADGAERLRIVPNAVDTEFYRPPAEQRVRQGVLLVGNYENLPNLDGFWYFMAEIWPRVRELQPTAELSVVGAKMPLEMRQWEGGEGVRIVGEVADLRPIYHGHRVLAVPLRAGSGTRLKLLEAFAAGIPAVSTTLGAEGIEYSAGTHLLIADDPAAFAHALVQLLTDDALHGAIAQASAELAALKYDWRLAAAESLHGLTDLLAARPASVTPSPVPTSEEGKVNVTANGPAAVDISIIIPTLNGGALLADCLAAIERQEIARTYEVICVDSGSRPDDLAVMERLGARLYPIQKRHFNHGLTRDLGASLARGQVLVFLNQDAVPQDAAWLSRLTAPLFAADPPAAVQGGILEFPHGHPAVRRFFWDSCGERFYFTRESARWIQRYAGIGFSTVNAALRREIWAQIPFGWAPIMEDKKWQREVVEAGYRIVVEPGAAVYHTHDYDLRALTRRCQSEGWGWQMLGEAYGVGDALRDLLRLPVHRELLRGLRQGRVRTTAEFLFPWWRPVMLYFGNRWLREVRL